MKLNFVFRWDGVSIYRLLRVMGIRGTLGDAGGYSWKLSLALTTRPSFKVIRSYCAAVIYIGFLRIGYQRSYGGIHA